MNPVCVWRHDGHADLVAGPVSQSKLDLAYPVYRVQLFSELFYRLLSAQLADEEIWHEIRGGTRPGRVKDSARLTWDPENFGLIRPIL